MAIKTLVSPMLSVRRGAEAIEFYKNAFGAMVLFRHDGPDGGVVATLSIEGAEFWVADESPEHQNCSPETLKGSTTRLVLTIEDPDAMFLRAVKAGATVVRSMCNDYGWRLGRVLDPYGHHWEIGKPLGGSR
jgi:PhnB protein